jgi:hypothetical protein
MHASRGSEGGSCGRPLRTDAYASCPQRRKRHASRRRLPSSRTLAATGYRFHHARPIPDEHNGDDSSLSKNLEIGELRCLASLAAGIALARGAGICRSRRVACLLVSETCPESG